MDAQMGYFRSAQKISNPLLLSYGLQEEHIWSVQITALMNGWKDGQKVGLLAAKSCNSSTVYKMNDEKGQS